MREIVNTKVKSNVVELCNFAFDYNKIYICEYNDDLYKLHKISDAYMFCCLNNSVVGANGVEWMADTLIEDIICDGGKLYEFDNFDEFVSWYNER